MTKQSATPDDSKAGQPPAPDEPKAAQPPAPDEPAFESAALRRLRATRRKPTQIGTAVDCLRELKGQLGREFDTADDETGFLSWAHEILDRALGLARIGHIF